MKKSIFALFMTLICAALFAQNAASDFTIGADGVITKYNGWDTAVVIPETVNGIRVTAIGNNAFSGNDLTSVTIPHSVISIGERAFSNNKLASVTVPGNNVTIGDYAFANNPLTSITLGNNHVFDNSIVPMVWASSRIIARSLLYDYVCNDRKAGTYAANRAAAAIKSDADFNYIETQYGAYIIGYFGSSRNRLIIPSRLGNLPVKALSGLSSVSRVQIPDSVTYIANGAFIESQLTEITIPNSVTFIGDSAFASSKLTSVTIGNSVAYIGNEAFAYNQLTEITIPNGVTYIGYSAFESNRLTSVTIPDSVTYIGSSAFIRGDNQLTSVTIGANVTLGNSAIGSGFETAYNNGGKPAGAYKRDSTNSSIWGIASGDFLYIDSTITRYTGSGGTVIIPADINGTLVTSIGANAFSGSKLISVTIPNSITSIGDRAFQSNQLTEITIPNSVTTIGNSAFYGNQLTSVTIPDSVTSIGERAFYNNRLTSVTVGNGVTSIEDSAFSNNRLTSVIIGDNVTLGYVAFGFENVYNANGKAAGTYVQSRGVWTKQ